MQRKATPTGLRIRHSRQCASSSGAKCNCTPAYEAWAWDKRTGQKIRKTFTGSGALSEAKSWRSDATGGVRRGTMRTPSRVTLREAANEWLEGVKAGTIRNRSGDEFKPSTLHGYEHSLNLRILPRLGAARLSDITRNDLQDLVDRMLGDRLDASTIRNALMPLRAIFGRAVKRGDIAVNPTSQLDLPAVRGRRDRIVGPTEAAELLEQLPIEERAVWATALYAGLRRGELLALRWDDVDLAAGVIRVERSYDPRSGRTVAPKSRAGTRRVPILAVLRDHLDEHKLRASDTSDLVFGRADGRPFNHSTVIVRASAAWKAAVIEKAREAGAADAEIAAMKAAPFDALTLHEARHSFASMMIAAGVGAKPLSTYMGHSSISITLDRYGHLMPGSEEEASRQADAYLARADTKGRLEQIADE